MRMRRSKDKKIFKRTATSKKALNVPGAVVARGGTRL